MPQPRKAAGLGEGPPDTLPRGQTKMFTTQPRKAAGLGEGPPKNVLFTEVVNAGPPGAYLRHVPTQNDGQRYDSTIWSLFFWGSIGEEKCLALSLKRAYPQRPEVTSPYPGHPEGGERGEKLLAKTHQQLMRKTSTSYSGMQRVCIIKRSHS